MRFSYLILILLISMLIFPINSIAQDEHECGRTSERCFDPNLPLKPGEKFNWNVSGVNVSEQISTFQWNVYELTQVEVEILEEIRGLSVSIQRNFDKYFLYTNSITNTDTNESSIRTGNFDGGVPVGLISYNAWLDENEELINFFEWKVEMDSGKNFTTQNNFMNITFHQSRYGNSSIDEGVFIESHYSYHWSHPENDSTIILSTNEVFDEIHIEIDTGLLIYDNRTEISYDRFYGNTTSQRTIILEKDQDNKVEINLGNTENLIIVASVSSIIVLSIIVVLLLRRKSY